MLIADANPNFVAERQGPLSVSEPEQRAFAQQFAQRAGIAPVGRRIFDDSAKLDVFRVAESQAVAVRQTEAE